MATMRMSRAVLILACLIGVTLAQLPLTLVSNVFSSNMVLQREPLRYGSFRYRDLKNSELSVAATIYIIILILKYRANIWGWTTAGQSVNVKLTGPVPSTKTATAGTDGKWMISLDPTPAGGPYVLQVTSGTQNTTFTNVLFGDVFYCSGQSNMAYGLSTIFNGTDEANLAPQYPHIRLFNIPNIAAPVPFVPSQPNLVLNMTNRYWQLPSATGLLSFSAICWLNGRHLSDWQNNTIPIGLVNGPWAGMAIELFMSPAVGSNKECPSSNTMTSTIFNTMVYPLYPLQFVAMYWYQGEANLGRTDYGCMLSRMIIDYRKGFQNDFAFMVIQYAPRNITGLPVPITREQQRQGGVKAGYSCTVSNIDLGDEGDPSNAHPRTKAPLGYRSHLCTRKMYYNETDVVFSGPLPKCTVADTTANTLTIQFYRGTIGTGLELRDVSCPSFTNQADLLCRYAWEVFNGTSWYPAQYSLTADKQSLVLSGVILPTNLSVVQYRNGYAGWPLSVLYNSANLPPPNYVMQYQPDCSVDEIYQPDVPVTPSGQTPSVSNTPSLSTPSGQTSGAVLIVTGLISTVSLICSVLM